MRFVHSYWFKPALDLYGSRFNGGFLTARHFFYSWALSFFCLQRLSSEVVLVTDLHGKEVAENLLQLTYSNVSTELESLSFPLPEVWNLGKFIAYRSQSKPFIHVDIDAFLWTPLPSRLLGARLCAQSWEVLPAHVEFYTPLLDGMKGKFKKHLSAWAPVPVACDAINCGILGGNDMQFLHHYSDVMIELITSPDNRAGWEAIAASERGQFSVGNCAIALEQVGLSELAHREGVEPELLLLAPERGDAEFMENGFTHLVGSAKGDPRFLSLLEGRMERSFPALKKRIDNAVSG